MSLPNPFEAPAALPCAEYSDETRLLIRFCQLTRVMGASWIILGAVLVGLVVLALSDDPALAADDDVSLMAVAAAAATVFVVLGAMTCARQLWAVRCALMMGYLSTGWYFLRHQLDLAVFLILFVVVQAHRILRMANRLRAAGVSPTARLDEVTQRSCH